MPLFNLSICAAAVMLLQLIAASSRSLAADGTYRAYVGTYTGGTSKGIYAFRFHPTSGALTAVGLVAEAKSPSWLALHPSGRFLYAANETDDHDADKSGAVSAYAIDSTTGLDLSLKGTEVYESRGRMAVEQIKKDRELIMLSDAEHKRWMEAFKPLIAAKVAEAEKAGISAKRLLGAYGMSV